MLIYIHLIKPYFVIIAYYLGWPQLPKICCLRIPKDFFSESKTESTLNKRSRDHLAHEAKYPLNLLYTCIIKYKTSEQFSREGFSNFSKYKHHAPLLIQVFFLKIILWLFQYYNSSLHCDPIISPGINTFLNYTYLRMLPYVSAFLANKMVFKKNIFLKIPSYFIWVIIINLWERAWPFILTNLNPLDLNPFHLGCFEPRLVEIGHVVLERKTKI